MVFEDLIGNTPAWQQYMAQNAAYFATPAGQAARATYLAIRQNWQGGNLPQAKRLEIRQRFSGHQANVAGQVAAMQAAAAAGGAAPGAPEKPQASAPVVSGSLPGIPNVPGTSGQGTTTQSTDSGPTGAFSALTWGELTGTTGAERSGWQRFLQHNAAFLATAAGKTVLANLLSIKAQYQEALTRPPGPAREMRIAGLRQNFQNARARIQNNPVNPNAHNPMTNHPITGVPFNTPTTPTTGTTTTADTVTAPAATTYLPNILAPNYAFPAAEAVRNATYNPGLGGFMVPNTTTPGTPVGPGDPMGTQQLGGAQ